MTECAEAKAVMKTARSIVDCIMDVVNRRYPARVLSTSMRKVSSVVVELVGRKDVW